MARPRGAGWLAVAVAILARPSLWPTAARQARRLVPPGWWRRPPFRPWPGRAYRALRVETQYGDETDRAEAADVVRYLRWCRVQDRLLARGRGGPGATRGHQ